MDGATILLLGGIAVSLALLRTAQRVRGRMKGRPAMFLDRGLLMCSMVGVETYISLGQL